MTPSPTGSDWSRKLAAYKRPDTKRSLLELAITAGGLFATWTLAWLALDAGWWGAALALNVPAALFLVRLFMVQHDCGHGSFLTNRKAADWIGRVIGVLTLTPYAYWRDTHAVHHATSGDLDRRGLGAVDTLTVEEYRAASPRRRLGYRLYRHPLVLFGLGPFYVFFVTQRLPLGMERDGWRPWASTLGNTAGVVAFLGGVAWLLGPAAALLVVIPTMLLAATLGVWLFYIQHQFEGVEWSRSADWKPQPAALSSSSHYDLPQPLRWFSANIGVHHVHHLSSRIPFYRLSEVLRDHPELKPMGRVGLVESLRYARLALWDEQRGKLVTFREAAAA